MAPDHVVYIGTRLEDARPGAAAGLDGAARPAGRAGARAKRLTDGQTETIGQLTLAELHPQPRLRPPRAACRLRYRRRRDLLVALAARTGRARRGIAAGLHALIRTGPIEERVLALSAQRGLGLSGLRPHWHGAAPTGTDTDVGGIIVGYGTTTDAAYPRAVEVLAEVLAECSQWTHLRRRN